MVVYNQEKTSVNVTEEFYNYNGQFDTVKYKCKFTINNLENVLAGNYYENGHLVLLVFFLQKIVDMKTYARQHGVNPDQLGLFLHSELFPYGDGGIYEPICKFSEIYDTLVPFLNKLERMDAHMKTFLKDQPFTLIINGFSNCLVNSFKP